MSVFRAQVVFGEQQLDTTRRTLFRDEVGTARFKERRSSFRETGVPAEMTAQTEHKSMLGIIRTQGLHLPWVRFGAGTHWHSARQVYYPGSSRLPGTHWHSSLRKKHCAGKQTRKAICFRDVTPPHSRVRAQQTLLDAIQTERQAIATVHNMVVDPPKGSRGHSSELSFICSCVSEKAAATTGNTQRTLNPRDQMQ